MYKANSALVKENEDLRAKVAQPSDQGPDDEQLDSMRKKPRRSLDDPRPSTFPPDEVAKLERDSGALLAKIGRLTAHNDSLEKDEGGAKPVFFVDKGGSSRFPAFWITRQSYWA